MNLWKALNALRNMYRELPQAACQACGKCCVTPHLTFIEFADLLEHLCTAFSLAEWRGLLQKPMRRSVRFEGNYLCPLQSTGGRCEVYPARGLSCRLEGIPVMDRMAGRVTPSCPRVAAGETQPRVSPATIEGFIKETITLTRPFQGEPRESYFFSAINIEGWLAICFDDQISQPLFLGMQRMLRQAFDLEKIARLYQDQTGLAAQLKLIDSFFALAEASQPKLALDAVTQVARDFPKTGSFFKLEGKEFALALQAVVSQPAHPLAS